MVRKIIQLTESQVEALERMATEQGVSFSEMVRQSVDMLLTRKPVSDEVRRRAMEAVGYAHSGDRDVSSRHDDYLAEGYPD
jgi:DNA-binding PadR family transcriptional regulator